MNISSFLPYLAATASGTASKGATWGWIIFYVVIIGAMLYFMAVRPQKKQQKSMNEIASNLETGDSIVTMSGFYGVVVDIQDDIVVVEFGSNKNCRIPMKKSAIQTVEKPDGTTFSLDR